MDNLTSQNFCPCNEPPKNCGWIDGQLDNASGYVLENTFHEYMKQAKTYVRNELGINIDGVEPDGFLPSVRARSIVDIRIDWLTQWFEVKASGRNSIPLSYSKIRSEIDAMGRVFKNALSRGDYIFYHLVTTSNVLLNDTRSSIIKHADNLKIKFSHITTKYKIIGSGIYVKFITKRLHPGFQKSIFDSFEPVKLQGH